MNQRELEAALYKNGVCECKAAGKWKYTDVGSRSLLVCIVCKRPKYWPGQMKV